MRRYTHEQDSTGHHPSSYHYRGKYARYSGQEVHLLRCKDANKIEIAKAVEELFKVEVKSVNTVNCRGKKRRYGRFEGYTSSWKKAIVTLTEDSKTIEFFDGMM